MKIAVSMYILNAARGFILRRLLSLFHTMHNDCEVLHLLIGSFIFWGSDGPATLMDCDGTVVTDD